MHASTPYKRRQLIVDKPLQQRMVLAYVWSPTLALLVATALLCFFCTRLAHESRIAGVESYNLTPVLLTAIVFLVVATGSVVVSAIRFSHRVAGPMVAIDRVLTAVESGDWKTRIQLRERDFLHPVATRINSFLDHAQQSSRATDRGEETRLEDESQSAVRPSDPATV